VFSMIPALSGAEYARYGMVHRNTYINSPLMLETDGRLKEMGHVFPAGQMTGVEGYVESAASGLAMGVNAGLAYLGRRTRVFPPETAVGALLNYIVTAEPKHFQPMNVNFGLLPPLSGAPKDKKRRQELYADRALGALDGFIGSTGRNE